MPRLGFATIAVLAAPLVLHAPGFGAEDPKEVTKFLQGLRDRGYYDLAAQELERIRDDPKAPADLRSSVDYELGRQLLDEAAKTADLVRRKERLDQARRQLDAFAKANPDHPLAAEALVQLARLLVERGHLAMLQAQEAKEKADADAGLAFARSSFDEARAAYLKAEARLKAAYDAFPRFLEAGEERDRRDRAHTALMDAQLQKAVVDYEHAHTFPAGSPERTKLLDESRTQFEAIYKRYRTQFAGLAAQMWQGKCYEEKGELGPAMGIFNGLLEHTDPRLKPLQRHVGYFRIIVLGKRKEFALAADEAVRWLQANPAPALRRSREGLGVQLELAKDLLAQAPDLKPADREAATRRAVDLLRDVVKTPSPSKAEALALLQTHRSKAAEKALDPANLTYEEALASADGAIATEEWDRAIALLKAAVRRADPEKEPEKANHARYNMAFAYYRSGRFYEANVLAEHLARRYPKGGLSAKATEIGMAALAEAYNSHTKFERSGDLNRLIALATYTIATWPDSEPADAARMTLGQIRQGMGDYAKAVEAYGSVRPGSPRRLQAMGRVGATRWQHAQTLRKAGKEPEADAEIARAIEVLKEGHQARVDAGATAADAAFLTNACDLGEIYLETGRHDEALALLGPLASALREAGSSSAPPAGYPRLISLMLRGHVAAGQVDLAIADMTALQGAGSSGSGQAQLYVGLGELLAREMEGLRGKGDTARLKQTQDAYRKFLLSLVEGTSGESYSTLQWAGEQLLTLGASAEARPLFGRILKTYEADPVFLAQPGSGDRLLRTRLGLAAALRGAGDFEGAEALVGRLIAENPRTVEPRLEKAYLTEDKAKAGKANWADAFSQWRTLALQLGGRSPKPVEYYDAWYHAALALHRQKKTTQARQTLSSVMRLSAYVGGPEMKKKYEDLLRQLR